jgi:membrane protein DedA with SNARE-associated domain
MSLSLINHLLQSYGYYAVFVFIALESLGIPLPGETTLIAAAIYAGSTGHLNIVVVFLVAAAAAVLGDNAGYWIGRSGGQRLVNRYGRFVRLDATKMKIGRYLFARHGGKVVFFGRFVTVLRTYAAFLAGLNTMHWRRFTAFNAAGGRSLVRRLRVRRLQPRCRRHRRRPDHHPRRTGHQRRADCGGDPAGAALDAPARAVGTGRLPRPRPRGDRRPGAGRADTRPQR